MGQMTNVLLIVINPQKIISNFFVLYTSFNKSRLAYENKVKPKKTPLRQN